jgi:hypothetical protein
MPAAATITALQNFRDCSGRHFTDISSLSYGGPPIEARRAIQLTPTASRLIVDFASFVSF